MPKKGREIRGDTFRGKGKIENSHTLTSIAPPDAHSDVAGRVFEDNSDVTLVEDNTSTYIGAGPSKEVAIAFAKREKRKRKSSRKNEERTAKRGKKICDVDGEINVTVDGSVLGFKRRLRCKLSDTFAQISKNIEEKEGKVVAFPDKNGDLYSDDQTLMDVNITNDISLRAVEVVRQVVRVAQK
ncbi:uncharacterized protein LOC120335933 [Styela clava]